MARSKALLVAGAAGDLTPLGDVFRRFGFDPPEQVSTLGEATRRLHQHHFDLLIVPLENLDAAHMALLERELRREPATSVIGTAPSPDPDLILRALRAGIHEFLVRPPNAKDLAASLERLTRRVGTDGKRGHVVAVYSPRGGLGVTTVAVNLAFAFAQQRPDTRVALADLVVGAGDVRVLLDLHPSYDIGDLVARQERVDGDVLMSLLTACRGGVWVLPASDRPETSDALESAATASVIGQLRSHFGVTVLDCEHHLSERTLAALDAANRIVLVTQLTIPALRSSQRSIQLFRRLGYADDQIWVVVNRFHSADVVSVADAESVLEHPIGWKVPNDFQRCASALSKGLPVIVAEPEAAVAESYRQLAAKLGGVLPNDAPAPTHAQQNGSRLGRLLRLGR